MIAAPTVLDKPRVWLASGDCVGVGQPSNSTWLRDDIGHLWVPDGRGSWHTEDNRHHATLAELRARTDLVEVTR